MGWAAFMDFLEEKLASDGLTKVHLARPAWAKWPTMDDIRENISEHQIIEAARDVKLLNKAETKALIGSLSRRNECAHPSGYSPGLNEGLGFVGELFKRIEDIRPRKL
jgi:hypothetical protein